jgi:hypothetical protein
MAIGILSRAVLVRAPTVLVAACAMSTACESSSRSVAPDSPSAPTGSNGAAGASGGRAGEQAIVVSSAGDGGAASSAPVPRPLLEAVAVSAPGAAVADPSDLSLCCGATETLVTGITAAEDLLFSTDGRLFVTGNDGIYELRRDSSGTLQATNLHPGENCDFTGVVEIKDTIYSVCTDHTNSHVFAGSLAGSPATPSFRKIYELEGILIANEIAADAQGRIYVAATLQGLILRLQIAADPFTVWSQESWLSTVAAAGIAPNGLRYVDSSIYWTDSLGGSVHQVQVLPDGSAGLVSGFGDPGQFFDDLYVNSDGTILVTSYLAGSLRAYGSLPFGSLYAQTPANAFVNPADVLPALGRLGFSDRDLLVTDKGANSVVALHLPF